MTDTKDLTEFKTKLATATGDKLCEIVVANRYLGIMQEEAVLCMEELARRRDAGDPFEFEKKIEELHATLPKFKLDMKQIMSPKLSSILGIFKK